MNRTWLITGSSRGFGRALAETAPDAGDQVVATARRPEQLDNLVVKYGDRIHAVALDVTDATGARAVLPVCVAWKPTPTEALGAMLPLNAALRALTWPWWASTSRSSRM